MVFWSGSEPEEIFWGEVVRRRLREQPTCRSVYDLFLNRRLLLLAQRACAVANLDQVFLMATRIDVDACMTLLAAKELGVSRAITW